jgi:hypothetical protein
MMTNFPATARHFAHGTRGRRDTSQRSLLLPGAGRTNLVDRRALKTATVGKGAQTMRANQNITPEERFQKIVKALRNHPGVTPPSDAMGSKRFGSSALQINGRIFAMITSKGQFVVKLPREHVEALVASGVGQRFDPGHGRLMKEWLAVESESEKAWLRLAREAMEFVGSKGG